MSKTSNLITAMEYIAESLSKEQLAAFVIEQVNNLENDLIISIIKKIADKNRIELNELVEH